VVAEHFFPPPLHYLIAPFIQPPLVLLFGTSGELDVPSPPSRTSSQAFGRTTRPPPLSPPALPGDGFVGVDQETFPFLPDQGSAAGPVLSSYPPQTSFTSLTPRPDSPEDPLSPLELPPPFQRPASQNSTFHFYRSSLIFPTGPRTQEICLCPLRESRRFPDVVSFLPTGAPHPSTLVSVWAHVPPHRPRRNLLFGVTFLGAGERASFFLPAPNRFSLDLQPLFPFDNPQRGLPVLCVPAFVVS